MTTNSAATPEPQPIKNDHPAIADVVAADLVSGNGLFGVAVAHDIMARKEMGIKKYGTPLQPFNGRNTHNDLYQELLDAAKYARLLTYQDQYGGVNNSKYEGIYFEIKRILLSMKKLERANETNGQAAFTSTRSSSGL